ncbi:hypothetical protein BC828DRAFT_406389 [Blastocladiella britannica]|nr:hypothetical protein BC828DRAFT_406389 [Blastocladiella britannica]
MHTSITIPYSKLHGGSVDGEDDHDQYSRIRRRRGPVPWYKNPCVAMKVVLSAAISAWIVLVMWMAMQMGRDP